MSEPHPFEPAVMTAIQMYQEDNIIHKGEQAIVIMTEKSNGGRNICKFGLADLDLYKIRGFTNRHIVFFNLCPAQFERDYPDAMACFKNTLATRNGSVYTKTY